MQSVGGIRPAVRSAPVPPRSRARARSQEPSRNRPQTASARRRHRFRTRRAPQEKCWTIDVGERRPAWPIEPDPAAQVMVAGYRGAGLQQQPRRHRKCRQARTMPTPIFHAVLIPFFGGHELFLDTTDQSLNSAWPFPVLRRSSRPGSGSPQIARVVASRVVRTAEEASEPSHPCFQPAAAGRTALDRSSAVAATWRGSAPRSRRPWP